MWSLLLSTVLSGCSPRPGVPGPATASPAPPTLEDARAFYAAQPTYLQPLPPTPVPAGLPDLRASTCGACHTEIYDEWQRSTHAHAWEGDPQFMAELHKSSQPDRDVGWMCVNCHTPVERQLPRLVGRLQDDALHQPIYVDNPDYDPTLQLEAITCATCHVRDGVILGPWGDSDAPHPVQKAEVLLQPEACTRCHQAQAHFPEQNLACVFSTGDEWAAGPYAPDTPCQGCHMPAVERPVVSWGPTRQTRRHWFGGSLIPKTPADEAALAPLRAAYPQGLAVTWAALPAPGETTAALSYQNAAAGHMLPTGDPERFLLVSLRAYDDQDRLLAEEEVRIGSVYEWYPEVRLVSDNRLRPLETRTLTLSFPVPPPGSGVRLEAEASKWRISPENLAYHSLEGILVPGGVIFSETRRLAPTP